MDDKLDNIFKALADPTRRQILDLLRAGPLGTGDVVKHFPKLSRFGVMKHLDVLKEANLVIVKAEGRQRINSLNAIPIRMMYERWVSNYAELWSQTLLSIARAATQEEKP